MKAMITLCALTLLTTSAAFAGNFGEVECDLGGRIDAHYSWFHSNADSYSELTLSVVDANGHDEQHYTASNESALEPLTVVTKNGTIITVTPDLENSTCTILED